MTKPIPDKAEDRARYPDKLYVGTFERSSRFEAHLDPTGIALILERPGTDDIRKSIHMHINFGLFADILRELASTVGRIPEGRYFASRSTSASGHRVAKGVGCKSSETMTKSRAHSCGRRGDRVNSGMSPCGTWRTGQAPRRMSAFEGKAGIQLNSVMSAFDPKRTSDQLEDVMRGHTKG